MFLWCKRTDRESVPNASTESAAELHTKGYPVIVRFAKSVSPTRGRVAGWGFFLKQRKPRPPTYSLWFTLSTPTINLVAALRFPPALFPTK